MFYNTADDIYFMSNFSYLNKKHETGGLKF
jgi:hypothetical protein